EQRATFRSLPGTAEHRLPAKTSIRNFVLAGDWTDTGWPATMEGAVRSGETAAAHIMANAGSGTRA
ncbi:MAG: FAD-dependent oxidoreductase, partial [Chloroflexi bacterium]|nr:FAD-dependent oxidoreductase [Chloroflexota bacterium]